MNTSSFINSTRIEILTKDNYDSWCVQAEALLVKSDGWGYANGTIKKPTSDATAILQWEMADKKARADIILSIAPNIAKRVAKLTTSREVWLNLKETYASIGPIKKATLLHALTVSRMSEEDDIHEHLNSFFDIISKLETMEINVNDELITTLVINSLPDSFENFAGNIRSRDELPTPEQCKIKILEEFERRKSRAKRDEQAMIAAKRYYNRGNKFHSNSHSTGKPKEKHFPFRCSKCGEYGHKAACCPTREDQKPKSSRYQHPNYQNDGNRRERANLSEESYLAVGGEESFRVDVCKDSTRWCLDSGSSSHSCKEKSSFETLSRAENVKLNLASNSSTAIQGKGKVRLPVTDGRNLRSVNLESTIYVPDLRVNLMSVGKITKRGDHEVIFGKDEAVVQDLQGNIKMVADRIGDLYYVRTSLPEYAHAAETGSSPSDLLKWHQRMGHLNVHDLKEMVKNNYVTGIKVNCNEQMEPCATCLEGKLSALPFPKRTSRSDEPLQLIFSDICGPMRVHSNGGKSYFVTFIDDYSRWTEVFLLSKKSDVFNAFKEYKKIVENKFQSKLKAFQSDNAREYISAEFSEYLKSNGIQRRLSAPRTPEQNGVAERKNRTLVEMARCLILQSGLPPSFWGEAILTANFVRNRCPTATLFGRTPYEYWTNRVPNLKFFRTFGETAFVLNKNKGKDKLGPKAEKAIFVGYAVEAKAYRLFIPGTKKILISRDVGFLGEMYYKPHKEDIISANAEANSHKLLLNEETEAVTDVKTRDIIVETNDEVESIPEFKRGRGRPRRVKSGRRGRPCKEFNMVPVTYVRCDSIASTSTDPTSPTTPATPPVIDNVTEPPRVETTTDQDNDDVFLDDPGTTAGYLNEEEEIIEYAFNAEVNFKSATTGPEQEEWKEAILTEVKSLMENETWEVVNPPRERKIIGCRYVLTNKYFPDGKLQRRKARLVAQGFTQQPYVDYTGTFAPVARLTSIRLLLALAVKYDMIVEQIDITTAYLNGTLDEQIYMRKPPMIEDALEELIRREPKDSKLAMKSKEMLEDFKLGKVCSLKSALYGLKQAGLQWNIEVNSVLTRIGLTQSKSDPCIYFSKRNEDLLLVSVYVDDFLIVSKNPKWIESIKKEMSTYFEVKDLGTAHYCLGIEIIQDPRGIAIKQSNYIRELIRRFNLEEANSVTTPLPVDAKSTTSLKSSTDCGNLPYRELIGGLMYIAMATRPDITYAVSFLSQFNHSYTKVHWGLAKRVLRYLIGTQDVGIMYSKSANQIKGYVDADWGSNLLDRKSYTGFVFLLSNGAISWKAQKQRTVALSSTEAEYIGITEAVKEAVYWSNFMNEIGLQELEHLMVYNDNQGAKLLVENPVFHQRTKHIDLRHHFIRDTLKRECIELSYLNTNEMIADVLTKPLPSQKHHVFIHRLGLRCIPSRSIH